MAIFYLKSTTGSDANNGSTWALAFASLAHALSQMAAGDTVYVSQAHAESQGAAITLTSPGTAALPCFIVCASDSANPPTALAATATVATTTNFNITPTGFAYVYGITFNLGSGANSPSLTFNGTQWWWIFDTCGIVFPATGAGAAIIAGIQSATTKDMLLELRNTTVKFGAVGQTIKVGGNLRWTYTVGAVNSGGSIPTTLFTQQNTIGGNVECRGIDLSALGSGKNLLSVATAGATRYFFENCKLGASVTFVTGSFPSEGGPQVEFVNCDSANTNYNYYKQTYQGTITTETTVVRTGGATDGTTAVSRKMVSTANSSFYAPLESAPIRFWNNSVSAVTLTVFIVNNSSVTTTNADVWMEVEELGTSSFPLSVLQTSRVADNFVTSNSNNPTDGTSSWGGSTTTLQKLSVTFTPTQVGPCEVRVMLAKPSFTMWFDPLVVSSPKRSFMIGPGGYINEETASGGSFTPPAPLVVGAGAW